MEAQQKGASIQNQETLILGHNYWPSPRVYLLGPHSQNTLFPSSQFEHNAAAALEGEDSELFLPSQE